MRAITFCYDPTSWCQVVYKCLYLLYDRLLVLSKYLKIVSEQTYRIDIPNLLFTNARYFNPVWSITFSGFSILHAE